LKGPVLEIQNLSHSYENGNYTLENIDLVVNRGEIISIIGASGCGKTTLLRIIAGLEKQSRGTIKINHSTASDANFSTPPENRNIGLVVQDRALFPHLTIYENVNFGIRSLSNEIDIPLEYLKLFKVEKLSKKYPHEISGGEQQRVALARSMAPNPNILLLDEPFNALDNRLKSELHNETKKILKEKNSTVIIVSHDLEEAEFFSDKIYKMENGQLAEISLMTKN
tara:strand:+ start:657 stop:1331 length:675 start_codon:yes stop_codon:yes gene_type:complete